MVPHLARDHGEYEEESNEGPGCLVIEELQIVSTQVEQSSHQGEKHQEGNGSCVVRRSEHADIHLCSLSYPLSNGLAGEPCPLYIHVVSLLGLPLGWEVHEDWSCIQLHGLEHIRALVEVNHGKEELVGVELAIPVAVGDQVVLITGLLTDCALPAGRQRGEHHYDAVVAGGGLDKVTELVAIELYHWALGREVHQLANLVSQGGAVFLLLGPARAGQEHNHHQHARGHGEEDGPGHVDTIPV